MFVDLVHSVIAIRDEWAPPPEDQNLACIENLTTLCEPNTERVTSLMKSQLLPSFPIRPFVPHERLKKDDGGIDAAETAAHRARTGDQNVL